MLDIIISKLRQESFLTTPISIVINPVYIIRSGLLRVIKRFARDMHGDILDLGCGSKPYESLFVNANTYIGVDVESSGHDHKDSKVDYYYDGSSLPFPDHSFDGVVSFEVFEHIFNIEQVLGEIHRVLKPNGRLLLSIPFAWDEHEIPYDYARYTSFGIAHILKCNGFKVVESVKTTTYVLAIFQMLIAYIYQHVLPRRGIFGRLLRVIVVFPLNLLALLSSAILPKRYEYYCNNVIVVEKL
jgi:SAM-dependent methyltransferase